MREHAARAWRGWFLLLIAAVAWGRHALAISNGVWVYPLDDVYIEMALARSLVTSATWGVWPGEFTGVSSSLLWPWLLTPGEWMGGLEWWPLALALGCAAWMVSLLTSTLHAHRVPRAWVVGAPLFLIAATPLVPTAVLGMEHVLQACLGWILLWQVASSSDAADRMPHPWAIGAVATALVAVRFDAAALVGAGVVVTAFTRQWRLSLTLAAAAAVPFLGYALIASLHDWPWLPTSIILKSRASGLTVWGDLSIWALVKAPLGMVARSPQLIAVTLAALGCLAAPVARRCKVALSVLLITLAVQLALADGAMPAMYRYDAYVLILLVGIIIVVVSQARHIWLRVVTAVALVPLVQYTFEASTLALSDVRWHQAAVRPLAQLFAGHDVGPYPAVHDLGDVSYRTHKPVLDLDALATPDVLRLVRSGNWDPDTFAPLAARLGTRVAAVTFGPGYRSPIPPHWIEVGRWMFDQGAAYTFFAPDESSARSLQATLISFAPNLPSTTTLMLSVAR